MTLNAQEQALQAIIREARASKSAIAGRDESRGVDLDGAYRIQSASVDGRVLKGYKFGLISLAKQEQMGLATPLYGRIYADMLYGAGVSLSNFINPRLEPEVALILKDDLAPDANEGAAWQVVGGYFLGIDILDSVWEGYRFTAAEVAADNTSGGGFILGSRRYAQKPEGMLRLYLDGKLQTEGHLEALGNPLKNLVWLAQTLGGLQAGQIIFLGSPAASIPAATGTLELVDADGNILITKLEE